MVVMRTGIPLVILALLAACTPMGVWLYEEPTVGLEDVLIDTSAGESALPPYVVLAVKNRNDFELSLRHIELVLQIDGRDIGRVAVDTTVTLAPIAVRPVRLKVPPLDGQARGHITALREGMHRYGIAGRARLDTPIGERRIGFQHEIRGEAAAQTRDRGGDSLARAP
jgi:hypothetical protein